MGEWPGQNTSSLSVSVLRNLSDKVYEKRRAAALEIESRIKELMLLPSEGGRKEVEQIINLLVSDYALSNQSNFRKGGLVGLAAAALALGHSVQRWLHILLPPVLNAFTDPDRLIVRPREISRVRYYGCEALYNIAKVARAHILDYFNNIFEGLCKLSGDSDGGVRNGMMLLDRLLKDLAADACLTAAAAAAHAAAAAGAAGGGAGAGPSGGAAAAGGAEGSGGEVAGLSG